MVKIRPRRLNLVYCVPLSILLLHAHFIIYTCILGRKLDPNIPTSTIRPTTIKYVEPNNFTKASVEILRHNFKKLARIEVLNASIDMSSYSQPHLYLLLSAPRSGVGVLGNLFRKMFNLMYFYDPVGSVYSNLYGLPEGGARYTDVYYSANGSERNLPAVEENLIDLQFDALYKCRFSKVTDEYILMNAWTTLANSLGAKNFINCVAKRKISLDQCTKHLDKICPEQLGKNEWQEALCQVQLELSRTYQQSLRKEITREILAYTECKWSKRQMMDLKCVPHLKAACFKTPDRVVSSAMLRMKAAKQLVANNHGNLRILYVVRDPRAVVFSKIFNDKDLHRKSNMDTLQDLFDGTPEMLWNEWDDINKTLGFEIRLHCNAVIKDLTVALKLQKDFPGSVFFIKFEDLIFQTFETLQGIYKLLHRDEDHFDVHTNVFLRSVTRERENAAFNYENLLEKLRRYSYDQLFMFHCGELFQMMPFYKI